MNAEADHNPTPQPQPEKRETIGGVLAAALNMEDDISNGVYEDYMHRHQWPRQLDDAVFAEIRKRLTVLIDDTRKHKKILQALVREYGRDK